MSKITELEIEVAKQKSRADTWEKAYFLLIRGKVNKTALYLLSSLDVCKKRIQQLELQTQIEIKK